MVGWRGWPLGLVLLGAVAWAEAPPEDPGAAASSEDGGAETSGVPGSARRVLALPARVPEPPWVPALPEDTPRVGFAGWAVSADGGLARSPSKGLDRDRMQGVLAEVGFDVPPPEDEASVFGGATGQAPAYLLGGRVLDADCRLDLSPPACEVMLRWEVFDTLRREVVSVEEVTALATGDSRHAALTTALTWSVRRWASLPGPREAMGLPAPEGGPEGLIGAVGGPSSTGAATGPRPSVAVRRCDAGARALPGGLDGALDAAVELSQGDQRGMGVAVSPDGWVLTAAHVVDGAATVRARLRAGVSVDARVVRLDRGQDVALVKLSADGLACLPLGLAAPGAGSDLWALGASRGDEDFSVARGIVSAVRTLDRGAFLQTDAGLSPGDSGGPLLTADGQVVALTSFKVAGTAYEGLSYGALSSAALETLGITLGARSAASLEGLVDLPDTAPSQVGGSDPQVLDRWARMHFAAAPTPVGGVEGGIAVDRSSGDGVDGKTITATVLVGSGIGVSTLGGAMYLGTLGRYLTGRTSETRPIDDAEWRRLQGANTAGLVLVGVGVAAIVPGMVIARQTGGSVRLGTTGNGLRLQGVFR